MSKDNEKALRKIKKMLSLSKSTNPHEAAKALEMAQKLMAEHQINMSDVVMSKTHNNQKFAEKHPDYIQLLINVINKAFGVKAYTTNALDGEYWGERKLHVVFYGAEERPLIASYCFDVLYRQLQQARKAFNTSQNKRLKRSTRIARADAFCEGWINGVHENVTDFALSQDERSQLQQYRDKLSQAFKFGESKTRATGDTRERNGDISALQGYSQGKQTKLSHGVNGQETAKLGVTQ